MEQAPDFSKCDFLNEMAKLLGQERVAEYVASLGGAAMAEAHTANSVISADPRPMVEATFRLKPEKISSLTKEVPSSLAVITSLANNEIKQDDQPSTKILPRTESPRTYFEHETVNLITPLIDLVIRPLDVSIESKDEKDALTVLQDAKPTFDNVATGWGRPQGVPISQEVYQVKADYEATVSVSVSDHAGTSLDIARAYREVQYQESDAVSEVTVRLTDTVMTEPTVKVAGDFIDKHETEWLVSLLADTNALNSVDESSGMSFDEEESKADAISFSARIDQLIDTVIDPAERPSVQELYGDIRRLIAQNIGAMAKVDENGSKIDMEGGLLRHAPADADQEVLLAAQSEAMDIAELKVKIVELLQQLGISEPQPKQIRRFICEIEQEILSEACEIRLHVDTGMREARPTGQPVYQTLHDRLRLIRQGLAKILIIQPASAT